MFNLGSSVIKEEVDVKKEPKAAKAKKTEIGKKRTHRQARTSRFLDIEAKEEGRPSTHV